MQWHPKIYIPIGAMVAGATVLAIFIVKGNHDLPRQKTIDVPFTSQAPNGDWSEPWQNACEETSIYMVSSFYGDDEIKREEAVRQIKNILAIKKQEFNVSHDESLQKIADLVDALGFPWSTKIVYDPTIEQLKQELSENRPIIVPVYAPTLTLTDGPDYHVMVLIGYDDVTHEFIVNDPGISNGAGRRFPYDKFMLAIHDLNQQDYKAGRKAVLFTQQSDWNSWFGSSPTSP